MNFFRRLFPKRVPPAAVAPSPATKDEVDACLRRAAELRLTDQNQAAIAECNRALSLEPNREQAFRIRALAKFVLEDRDGAIEDWNQAESLRATQQQ